MKKIIKISATIIGAILAIAIVTLCILLFMGFRFSAEKAVHSYWHKGTRIEAGEYNFWLNNVSDENEELVYGAGHTAVKRYGFLYKELDKKNRKELINEYGDYIGSLTRYKGKETDHYFIHWVQSVTGIVDGKYTQSMRYFTDKIEINGKTVDLFAHCYFEFNEEIKTLVIKDENITVVDEYKKPPVSTYAPKPQDTSLEFWITQNVENTDFSSHNEIYGWMGAREFLGKGYSTVADEYSNQVKPLHYVSYIITAYPDYADGGEYVTQIDITDPTVSVYGLTVNSTIEEYDEVFRKMGFVISVEHRGEHRIFTAEKYGEISFIFDEMNGKGTPMLTIKAKVTNREGIDF